MKNTFFNLYEINKDVKCLKCGNKGAVKSYGKYYPLGLKIDNYPNKKNMYRTIGFGGTIPWECMNCNNKGLIDHEGLEGYKKAFITIKDKED